jgi:hypothetical protein
VGVSVAVPLVDCAPLHAPLAVHAAAFVDDQVRVALAPSVIVAGFTEIVTVGAAGAPTATVADALALPPFPVQLSVYVAVPAVAGVSVAVPLVASLPLHAPLAVQEVEFVDDQVSVVLAPSVMLVGLAAMVTVGFGWLLPPQAISSQLNPLQTER